VIREKKTGTGETGLGGRKKGEMLGKVLVGGRFSCLLENKVETTFGWPRGQWGRKESNGVGAHRGKFE